MRLRIAIPVLLVVGVVAVAGGCGFTNTKTEVSTVTVTHTVTHTVTTTSAPSTTGTACTAGQLSGTFAVEQGSAGAGNIVYKLTLTNTSQSTCFVSGIPTVTPLDASGNTLEYSASPNGTGTAVKATLAPGGSASAEARFTPDVDPCGKIAAATLRVTTPDGSTLDVKVDPPTRVCNHGAMQWSNLSAS